MKEIKNTQLKKALAAEGMSDIHLYRDNGFFVATSDTRDFPETQCIYTNNFSDMSIEEWVMEIKNIYSI